MRTTFGRMAAFAVIAMLLSVSVAIAGEPAKDKEGDKPAVTDQQNKMKRCNAEAGKKELKGDERKAFMSSCLKGGN